MTTSDACYRLIVAGRLSQTLVELIDSRFGPAASVSPSGSDSVVELTVDQPALRALLTLLWDFGHDLVAILQGPFRPDPAEELAARSSPVDGCAHLRPPAGRPTTTSRSTSHDQP